jgi:hypothetical protein
MNIDKEVVITGIVAILVELLKKYIPLDGAVLDGLIKIFLDGFKIGSSKKNDTERDKTVAAIRARVVEQMRGYEPDKGVSESGKMKNYPGAQKPTRKRK